MAKYEVNAAYDKVPVKIEFDGYSNALKGTILGLSPAEAHLAIKDGKASLVDHPKGTKTYKVNVSDAGVVTPVDADPAAAQAPAGTTQAPAA